MHKIILGAAIAATAALFSTSPFLTHAAPGIRLVSSAVAQTAPEQSYKLGALTITAPWTRVTPKGARVAAGYVRITNTGAEPDRLVGGAFDLSARVEVHEMSVDGGVMRMRELSKGLEIAPGASVELKPGGYHLMFMDMKGALEVGKPVKGRITFEKAGSIDVEFGVAPLGAATAPSGARPAAAKPAAAHGGGHNHH
ncbi:MAG: copper chaperone PCu(A)C [Beijerinckiaceae bacterium]|nr:copper chaperone PCu(A)C [Beijerinckiaceae bacterium]